MLSALRSAIVFAFASALTVLALPGCSQQGAGERCDSAKSGNDDCESGLTCVSKMVLVDISTDRCCPPAGTDTDARCARGARSGNTGGSSSGGTSGSGGTDASSGGTGGTDASTGGTDASSGGTDASTGGTGGTDASSEAGAGGAAAGNGG
jgi:hypothetical protein